MKTIVKSADEHGALVDPPDTGLPIQAFTRIENGALKDGRLGKSRGERVLKPFPGVIPEWLLPYSDPESGAFFWIYPGIDTQGNYHIATWDGAAHVVRTRGGEVINNNPPDVGYTRSPNAYWTGGVINGLAYVNPGADIPQKWDRTAGVLNADFEDFANWPVGWIAEVMRTFSNFIMAYDVNKGAGRDPYRIQWSDEVADPFTEPGTWIASPGNRAGGTAVSETGGYILDSLPMRNLNIVYRESQVMIQRFIGGNEVFKFDPLFDHFGLLTQRCAKLMPKGRHFVAAAGDIRVHDGTNDYSVAEKRVRNYIFNVLLDPDNYRNAFVVPNYLDQEMWFCFPTVGNVRPNRAAIWNYDTGAWSFRDLTDTPHIGIGFIPSPADVIDTVTDIIDTVTDVFDSRSINPTEARLIGARNDGTAPTARLTEVNSAYVNVDGQPYQTVFERTGIGILETDEGVLDEHVDKEPFELWVSGLDVPINAYVGGSDNSKGPYTWVGPLLLDPSVSHKVDVRGINHKWLGVRFEDNDSSLAWSMTSWGFRLEAGGERE